MPSLRVRLPDVYIALVRLGQGKFAGADWLTFAQEDFRAATLVDLDYSGKYFDHVHLAHSQIMRTKFSKASIVDSDLSNSDLTGAALCGTWLRTTSLTGATLTDAIADADTVWPEGFDYVAAGVNKQQVRTALDAGTDCPHDRRQCAPFVHSGSLRTLRILPLRGLGQDAGEVGRTSWCRLDDHGLPRGQIWSGPPVSQYRRTRSIPLHLGSSPSGLHARP